MKNSRFKRVYLLELTIAVTISLGVGSIMGMKYFSHVYSIQIMQAHADMNINKRIDFLEQHIKKHCKSYKESTPVSL